MAEDKKEVKGAAAAAPTPSQGEGTQVELVKEKASKASRKYLVVSPFADKDNFGKKWEEGDDVSHFDENRLKTCIERGLVKKA